jgi:hypothetical protein
MELVSSLTLTLSLPLSAHTGGGGMWVMISPGGEEGESVLGVICDGELAGVLNRRIEQIA